MFFFHLRRAQGAPPLRTGPRTLLDRLFPCRQPDQGGFRREGDRSLLVQGLHWNTPQSRLEPTPFHHGPSGVEAAAWARLDNRGELAAQLRIAPAELPRHCDTELIVLAYLRWGESCVERFIGDFAFVIRDPGQDVVFCGRDHLGARPLYYLASDDVFACATTLAALNPLEGACLEVDPCWVAEYALGLSKSFDRTPYRPIRKLPPGHCLTVSPGQVRLRQYFQLGLDPELKLRDSREYVDAYRTQLEEAVRCRLVSDYPIGSELSGGLDSSAITAFAARLMDRPEQRLHAFGYAFQERESEYIGTAAAACRLAGTHIFTDRKTFLQSSPDRVLALLGYPEELGLATSLEPFYQEAEGLGVRTLLSGFGGDEFGTTLHGDLVPLGLAVGGRYRELLRILPGNLLTRVLRLAKLELRRRRTSNFTQVPPGARLKAYRLRWPHRVVRDEWVRLARLEERFFDEGRLDMGYTDLKTFTLERRWAPFIPTRMENCTLIAAGRGIEYRWPLLDVRLVRLFLSIPSEENYFRGIGRYLHRRAVTGVVPERVAWKASKDMGDLLPQGQDDPSGTMISDAAGLHPGLADYLDCDLLQRQIEAFPNLRREAEDGRYFQFRNNIRAATHLSAWLKHLDALPRAR